MREPQGLPLKKGIYFRLAAGPGASGGGISNML
jgi:hypothetical protein